MRYLTLMSISFTFYELPLFSLRYLKLTGQDVLCTMAMSMPGSCNAITSSARLLQCHHIQCQALAMPSHPVPGSCNAITSSARLLQCHHIQCQALAMPSHPVPGSCNAITSSARLLQCHHIQCQALAMPSLGPYPYQA